jgi:proline iminopeptidase
MPLISLNNTNLFYERLGDGWPCFVLHGGLGTDHTYFRPWLDPLAARLQLIYLDLRGNGRSDRPAPETITFTQLCDDLEALRQSFGYARVALLGHSYGGFIALDYARRYPDQVSHLILVDTVAVLDFQAEIDANFERLNPSPDILAGLEAEPQSDAEFEQAMRAASPLYFDRFDPALAAAAFEHIRWSLMANQRGFELLSEYDMLPYLHVITAPALCVSGSSDFLALPSQVQRLAAGLVQGEAVIIEQCGHFPFIEQPQVFRQLVDTWLRDRL